MRSPVAGRGRWGPTPSAQPPASGGRVAAFTKLASLGDTRGGRAAPPAPRTPHPPGARPRPQVGAYFNLTGRKSRFSRELRGGIVTFLTAWCGARAARMPRPYARSPAAGARAAPTPF